MKIVIIGPTHKSFIGKLLNVRDLTSLPDGYYGAPFLGVVIKELLNRGHNVISITTTTAIDHNYEVREFHNGNFKWIVVPAREHTLRFNKSKLGRIIDLYAFEQRRLKSAILNEKPDFVHAHWSYEFAGALAGINIPKLITIHDNPYQVFKYMRNIYRFGRLILSEINLKKLKFASTVSPYMLDYAQKRFKNLKVIPNPVVMLFNIDKINEYVDEKINSLLNPNIVMIMNGWDKRKNGDIGLEAFGLIKNKIPGAILHLFGNGSEMYGLANKSAKPMRLEGIFYHGPVPHETLLNELKKMHLMIHPSLEESFGVVLIEAMALGLPVIGGIRSGAVPWVINNPELLVDVSKAQNIADKAIEILTCKIKYKEISSQGFYNVSERFSASAVVDSYEGYYDTIIQDSK
ncbi:glycosyltransferase family 4 protein [Dyadobacter psychrotolerans]|uniref:Glycosyltransferase n=1 Tax=Dyadobacter psychrotolerans TaxID=2541721 RepID=A0A4R5DCZ8_9BACT|nr:glycosyltransferase family 4 protein [Dyadobacter psychrotolerans]TDE08405.1 glycosyltransferase [Dyadobacter psychrotolerans]